MTGLEYADSIWFNTNTDSDSLPLAKIIAITNAYLPTLSSKINQVNNKMLGVPAVQNLVANQREYSQPSDVLRALFFIELNLKESDSAPDNWCIPKTVDLELEDKPTSEADISRRYGMDSDSTGYMIFRDGIFVFSQSVSNVTGGLKLWYGGRIEPLTVLDSTELSARQGTGANNWKHGIPIEFHEWLTRYVQGKYKKASDIQLADDEVKVVLENDLSNILTEIRNIDKNKVIDISPRSMVHDGNYGWDY